MKIRLTASIVMLGLGSVGTIYWAIHSSGLDYILPIMSGGLLGEGVILFILWGMKKVLGKDVLDTCPTKHGDNSGKGGE